MKILACEVCQNEVIVLYDGKGEMTCCGLDMKEVEYNIAGDNEYHIPEYFIKDTILYISVKNHPNTNVHYIEKIIAITNKGFIVRKPNKDLTIALLLEMDEKLIGIYSYCTLHGWWRIAL